MRFRFARVSTWPSIGATSTGSSAVLTGTRSFVSRMSGASSCNESTCSIRKLFTTTCCRCGCELRRAERSVREASLADGAIEVAHAVHPHTYGCLPGPLRCEGYRGLRLQLAIHV